MSEPAKDASVDALENHTRPLDGESKPLFEAAFRAHHASLLQFLRRRVVTEAEARDIAQEAYLRLFRYREQQDLSSLKALVYRIATNLVGMRARKAHSQHLSSHGTLDEEDEVAANDPLPEECLIAEQHLNLLMSAIERLPPKCQQVFILSRFHDMGYLEIAARCRISVKMVEKHITHALAICRQEVGGESP